MSEIRKGVFVYRDTFFADPGNDKRHPRASVAELKDLLLPKKGQVPPRDQVAHWYEAQLLHYGLQRTKDKNTAKVRLTAAVNAGSLAVPSSIVQMETDMKKEYAAAIRKTKAAAAKALETAVFKEAGPKSKKRKAEDDVQAPTSTTKVSFSVGDVTVNIDHQGGVKKRKTASAPTTSKKPASKLTTNDTKPVKEKKSTTATKQTISPTKTTKAKSKSSVKNTIASSTPQLGPKTGTSLSPRPKKQPVKKSNIPSITTTTRPSAFSPSVHEHRPLSNQDQYDEMDVDDSPPSYSSHNFDYAQSNNGNQNYTHHLQVSGTYMITAAFDDMQCELTLVKNEGTGQFWGHFSAADHTGVIYIPDMTGVTKQHKVVFSWRAEDLGSGQLRFRRDQDGWIQFDGQGRVKGCWNSLLYGDDLEFEGELDDEPDRDVDELIDRWEWFVSSAYGR